MATTSARGISANPCRCRNPTPQPIIPTFNLRDSVTFTPPKQRALTRTWHPPRGTPSRNCDRLDQCHERDLRRTAETERRTIDPDPARRVHRHSRRKVEPLHE